MLIIDVFVNHNLIDELMIHNTGWTRTVDGIVEYKYLLREPDSFQSFWCRRGDYKPLLRQVLKYLEEKRKE